MKKKISIVIALAPDRNAEIIESIMQSNYNKTDYEVIVEKGLNPSNNRNNGANKSKGEIIAFLDDDATLDPEIFQIAEDFFSKHKEIDIVGGVQLTPKEDQGFARISGYALASIFGAWKISNRYAGKKMILDADETMLTSAVLFCRKEVMDKVKFDPRLFPGEDPKFISDAKNQGFKVAYNPFLKIYHKRRPTLKGMNKQIFNYGKVRPKKESFFETLFKRPYFLIPIAFIIYLFILSFYLVILLNLNKGNLFLNGNISLFGKILLFPFLLYVLLSIIFSVISSIKNRDLSALVLLPFIFLAIHLSYGFGMIYGYFKKI